MNDQVQCIQRLVPPAGTAILTRSVGHCNTVSGSTKQHLITSMLHCQTRQNAKSRQVMSLIEAVVLGLLTTIYSGTTIPFWGLGTSDLTPEIEKVLGSMAVDKGMLKHPKIFGISLWESIVNQCYCSEDKWSDHADIAKY